ncbi:MAG: NAD(P)/FAD-dependent oxidoreductase [Nanoarchaeota archaeon]|nr:NAD(P)/FAD-dependent oxidoreductase [Nanoarchaeota archaeon]MBU4300248.1 NAD(P)/FAD-dependent oxidoreductase [Nanoarchaeota archaeon]MBU4452538.1 NAD(P)/FAD-dependent oxidoreductase [Nanoarchaeota archaeon]MCG2723243.1 NAD(P)/FAD-dependent oxidoreductase [archaeon]
MSEKSYDIIVVGAGISGLLSALALGKEGKKVLLLEKSGVVGGNCRTYEVQDTGFFVDTGVHAITGLDGGPLVKLMDAYFNSAPKFVPHGDYYVRYPEGFVRFPNTIKGFMNFKAISKSDRAKLTKTVLKAITHLSVVEKSDISAYDFVKDEGLSDASLRLIDALSYFSSGISMKETPAWRILSAGGLVNDGDRKITEKISDFFKLAVNKSYHEQGYPLGGIQTITNCVLQSFTKNVGVKTNEEVVKLTEKNNGFRVETKKEEYSCDTIIYSGEVKNLPKLTDMPNEWAASAKKLKQSKAMTIWLGLKNPINTMNYRGSELWFSSGAPYWAMPTTGYDPHLAPAGKQLIGFSAFLHPDEDPIKHEKHLLETIYSAIPGIEDHVEMRHTQILIPEKAAISTNIKFPEVRTPIKNMYVVGTDTDMRSMGVTRASYSVIEMLKAMRYLPQ